jgi:hypothetical protein
VTNLYVIVNQQNNSLQACAYMAESQARDINEELESEGRPERVIPVVEEN